MSTTDIDFDTARFSAWLHHYTGQPAEISVTPIAGGGSCEMFRIERLGRSWVVRRAPRTPVSSTAHQVTREAQIMEALAAKDVPVPTVLACTDDPGILGAPFFVMSYIEGHVVRRDGLPEVFVNDPGAHGAIGEQLIDTLVQLHSVDWQNTALTKLSRPQGFLDRQVSRWLGQLNGYRERELGGVDAIAAWLNENLPTSHDLTVMHGDYKIDNVIWAPTCPPRIACIVDFEMATVGDPLVDLAWAMTFWPDDGNAIALASPAAPNGIDPDHCQTPEQLVNRYAEATGRDLTHFTWYQVFSAWKLAIVLEASYAKYLRKQSVNPIHEFFGYAVDQLLLRAQTLLR